MTNVVCYSNRLLYTAHTDAAATAFTSTVIRVIIPAIFTRAGTSPPPLPLPLLQLRPACQPPIRRYHKGLRHGSGVYKFKGLPPGGIKKQAHADDADEDRGGLGEEPSAQAERAAEGGVYIGEWNSGCMQGLGILKYDDGER